MHSEADHIETREHWKRLQSTKKHVYDSISYKARKGLARERKQHGENTKAEQFTSENFGRTVTQNTTIWKTRELYERIVEIRPHRGRQHPYDWTPRNPTRSPEDVLTLPVRSAGTPPGGASGPSAITSWRLARTGQCLCILTRLLCKTS